MFWCFHLIILVNFILKSNSSNPPLILFNDDENGISVDFLQENTTIIAEGSQKFYLNDHKVKGIDYNFNHKYLIWSSTEIPYSLYYAEFVEKPITPERKIIQIFRLSILLRKSIRSTRLAVDWIHNLVYFFKDDCLSVISVSNPEINYELTKSIYNTEGGIVVNPFDSFIVWTEYNTNREYSIRRQSTGGFGAVIRKSNGDGSNQEILVHENLGIPVCIAMDYDSQLIFWIDNELHSLSSIDYNGNNRKTIWQSKQLFEDCSSIDVFGDYVYWSSPKNNKIIRINKFGLDSEQTIIKSDNDIDFVKIMHPMRQKNATNYCLNSNCTHICLPSGKQQYRCLCSEQKYHKFFLHDNTCDEESIVFPAPVIPKLKPNTCAISDLFLSNDPLLLFTVRSRDIRIAKLPQNNTIYYSDSYFLHKTYYHIFGIDYNILENYLIWTKVGSQLYDNNLTLFRSRLYESENNTSDIYEQNSLLNRTSGSNTKTLAIDWIHNFAYFPLCNSYSSAGIFAVNLTYPVLLFQVVSQLNCVTKDIEVDPIESIIVWSEYKEYSNLYSYSDFHRYRYGYSRSLYDNDAKIKKSSQDGSNVQILVQYNIEKPNTLTLDMNEKKIYWIDISLYKLSSINYDGTNLRTILSSELLFENSFSMDLYEDYIYWSSNKYDAILKTNKNGLNGTKLITVLQAGNDIDGIKIVHNSSQPNGINKCVNTNCSHICLPSNGNSNYKCACPNGFTLYGTNCRDTWLTNIGLTDSPIKVRQRNSSGILENGPKLLYVVYKEGVFVEPNLDQLQINYIESVELFSDTDWITEVEFDYYENYILWLETSVFEGYSLYGAPIDKTKHNGLDISSKKLIDSKTYVSKRLALDWVHNLVYISKPKGIEVIAISDNNYYYDVISHDEIQGDIAVDPIQSIIVWSQWKYVDSHTFIGHNVGKIYKANQDGSNQVLLTSDSTETPATITIDLQLKTIYWIDTSSYKLYSIDYNGNNRSLILTSKVLFEDSFSMDVFGDYIYWSSYDKNAILKTNKYGLNNTEKIIVINAYTDLEGLKIMDKQRQSNITNKCVNSNCSQLCLPLPDRGHRCLCSKYRIGSTHSKCVETTTRMEVTTTAISEPNENATFFDNNNSFNITRNLDTLLNSKTTNENSSTHWSFALLLFLIGINIILIAIFIYRRKKMDNSKDIAAKFHNDSEQISLVEKHSDDT